MNDKTKQLNEAFPGMVKEIEDVLKKHNLSDLTLHKIEFIAQTLTAKKSIRNRNFISPVVVDEHLSFCPPDDQIHGCIECIDPATGEVKRICRP